MGTIAMEQAAQRIKKLGDKIHLRDCPKVERWLTGRRLRGYPTVATALAAAEKDLKPRAVDWSSILKFLSEILPLILPLFVKNKKGDE